HSTTNGYEVVLTDGTVYQPNALLLTIPHSKIPPLMPQEPVWKKLKNVPMSSVANIVLAFDEDDIGGDLEGTGFVVSRNSPFRITACTWTSRKWPATAPAGRVLLRAYVGKPTDQEIVKLPDDEIEQIVLHELSQMMTIKGNPLFSVVTRWQEQMPQYNVGHPATVQQLEENLRDRFPGMYIAGASYYGVGIPDCIEQGKERASSIIDYLQQFYITYTYYTLVLPIHHSFSYPWQPCVFCYSTYYLPIPSPASSYHCNLIHFSVKFVVESRYYLQLGRPA